MSVSSLDPIEARILHCLVDSAIGADCTVSVFDGEAWVLTKSKDAAAIVAALGSSDFDVLLLRRNGDVIGSCKLIYGNGVDVLSDWTLPKGTVYEGSWLEAVIVSALKVAGAIDA
ncbi:MAG: hypothetical protein [Microviridae sp.]|nr:MAG: hypothetical protein [Microviridae sp.]